ncbi:uncharacterized protein RAG0_12651 [Rhynchosporium agropyri]|uniref:Tc1-like transposase DDE domain-containing protein n=1 Tax=Rhynchosporium agropyri TaxID=914238 RepID=A0A1E1L949_9HELO|nr:uncharacterized protein RAG0_12651 [Rhynchosporium agropyri]
MRERSLYTAYQSEPGTLHERADVIEYRQKKFLPEIARIQALCTQYEEDASGVLQAILPILPIGEKEHVLAFHDESTFHGKEFSKRIWLDENQQKLPSKGAGALIHVSEFITHEGRLISGQREARKIIYPGAVFIFDQSSAHASKGVGALNAFDMNLTEGGAPEPQKATYFPPDINTRREMGDGAGAIDTPQELNWVRGTKTLRDKNNLSILDTKGKKQKVPKLVPRGIKTILIERGCFPAKKTIAKCSARILASHKDFYEQKSALEELLEARGHKCLFLPKFHCELNPIEMYWAYSSRRLNKSAWIRFNSCPTDTIRRYINRAFRFIDAYRKGLSVKQAAWCVKKQSGHRSISEKWMKEFDIIPEGNSVEVDDLA